MKKSSKTTVSLDTFTYIQGTGKHLEFASKAINILTEVVNHADFEKKVLQTKFSYCVLTNDQGKKVPATNEQVIAIIKSGKEWNKTADNNINLQIHLEKLRRKKVGYVTGTQPLITTNTRFFDYWLVEDMFLSLAAHWMHEWLHVAGFRHEDSSVDEEDMNYTVGKIVMEVGKSLLSSKQGKKETSDTMGYVEAMEEYYRITSNPAFSPLDLNKSNQNALLLGFVDTTNQSDDENQPLPIIPASSKKIGTIPVTNTALKTLNLETLAFYNDHMPDFFGGTKEGIFKVSINTRNPQVPTDGQQDVTMAVNFKVKDGNYAQGFLHRGLFRNVLITDFINLRFDLYEVDKDAVVYYEKVKNVVDSVPEMRTLDIASGIPYLNLATKLFEGIIKTFGKNANDQVWDEMPQLEVSASTGGAFLRSGIYVIFEQKNSKNEAVSYEDLIFKNNLLQINGNKISRMSNHLLLRVTINPALQSF